MPTLADRKLLNDLCDTVEACNHILRDLAAGGQLEVSVGIGGSRKVIALTEGFQEELEKLIRSGVNYRLEEAKERLREEFGFDVS